MVQPCTARADVDVCGCHPKYVYVSSEEWEKSQKTLLDLLARILMDELRREAKERHVSSPPTAQEADTEESEHPTQSD